MRSDVGISRDDIVRVIFHEHVYRMMSSPRPKSPRLPISTRKDEKEESFWDKIGTLGRKKRIKEGIVLYLCYIMSN